MNIPCIGLGLLLAICVVGAKGSCPAGKLACDDGQCIESTSWCDRKENCRDKSDEAYCTKRGWSYFAHPDPNKCKEDRHYLCNDGRCVSSHAKCNGYPDCKDRSDEDFCEEGQEEKQSKNVGKSNGDDISIKVDQSNTDDRSIKVDQPISKDLSKDNNNGREDDYTEGEDDYDEEEAFSIPSETIASDPITEPHTTATSEAEDYDRPRTVVTTPSTTTYYETYYEKKMTSTQRTLAPQIDSLRFDSSRRHNPPDAGRTSSYPNPYPTRATYPTQVTSDPRWQARTERTPNPYPQPARHHPRSDPHQSPNSYRTSDHYRPPYTPQRPSYIHSPGVHYQPSRQDPYYSPQHPHSRHSYLNPNGHPVRRTWPENEGGALAVVPYTGRRKSRPRFHFDKDYTGAFHNGNPAKLGAEWIKGLRDPSGGWGANTSRALVALALVNDEFFNGTHENDLMKKYLKVHLAVKLMNPESMGPNELAGHVNALLATCHDPRDFHGTDVVRLLRDKLLQPQGHVAPRADPFVLLSLCLADEELTPGQLHSLMHILLGHPPRNDRRKDLLSLSVSAFSCHLHRYLMSSHADSTHVQYLRSALRNATSTLLQLQLDDGSFGSIYSTALAAQALLSLNDTLGWNPDPLFRFLLGHQTGVGSFGDFLATYLTLPVISGRSLLHLRNIKCHNETPQEDLTPREILSYRGQKQYIRYSLLFGHPLSNAYSVQVFVPLGIHFFDVMRVADYQNKHFNFLFEEENGRIVVYSISDVPNDVERGLSWQLYIRRNTDAGVPSRNEAYSGDIRELVARVDEHYVFWYRPVEI